MMFIEKSQNVMQSGSLLAEIDAQRELLGINENIYNRSTGLTIELSNIGPSQDTAAATGISEVMQPDVVASENSDKDPPPGQDITGMGQGRAIAFIDSAVQNYQSLMAGITPGTEVIVLDRTMDGVTQITEELAQRENISSVHIVSHGSAGNVQLGNAILNSDTLGQQTSLLEQWGTSLKPNADILLYGCNVAADAAGKAFVRQLSAVTGADIAASDDLTGGSALGGDGELEVLTGNIEASQAFQEAVLEAYNALLANVNVGAIAFDAALQIDTASQAPGSTAIGDGGTAQNDITYITNGGDNAKSTRNLISGAGAGASTSLGPNGITRGGIQVSWNGGLLTDQTGNDFVVGENGSAGGPEYYVVRVKPVGASLTGFYYKQATEFFDDPSNGTGTGEFYTAFDLENDFGLTAGSKVEYIEVWNMLDSDRFAGGTGFVGAGSDLPTKSTLDTTSGETIDSGRYDADIPYVWAVGSANLTADAEVMNTNDSGTGSLRQAIINAQNIPGADTITFTGTTFTNAGADTIPLASELSYTGGAGNDLTIQAPGNSRLTIIGGGVSRVFNINSAANVTLDGLIIAGGNTLGSGGGILKEGSGTLNLLNSTLNGNTANADGGGISITFNGGTVNVTNSTISGNTSNGGNGGGGISNLSTLNVTNSTIANNNMTGGTDGGGGIFNFDFIGATANIRNTIVAGNTGTSGPDVFGAFTSNNSNLIGDTTDATGFSMSEEIVGSVDTVINTTLADNEATTTQTHALVAGSPALDAGNNSDVPAGITTDQRGTGFARVSNGTVDIGAYEIQTDPNIAIASPAIAAANVLQGTLNHPLYQLDLAVTTANTQLTGATFTTGGSYIAADIVADSFELFYSTDTTFDAGDTSLGTQAVVTSGSNLAFTGLSQTINSGTTGTLFLVADIAAGATAGNTINIAAPTLSDITFAAGNKSGTPTAGGLQIFDAIPTITSINSSTSNGTFGVGNNVDVTVNFSENVTLAGGNLTVNLDTGGTVSISSLTNSNTASGTYTVGAGENSADLNSISPLVLAGGATLRDATGNNVTLTIPGGQSLADNNDIVIDTTAPGAPSVPDMTAATDTGSSNTDNITSNATPTFTGTAAANSTVTLTSSVNGNIGMTTADGAGNWTITASTLSEGAQNITATATDGGGNTSVASSALGITIDTTAPTVTINQGGSQADPTAAGPIDFTVIFNESVTDFITGDVTTGGTASGTLTGTVSETAPNDGTTYNVAVSGMTGNGTVTASLGAGVAMDLAGNANAASTSTDNTVTFNANSAPVLDLNGGGSGIDHSATFIRGGGEVSIVDSANLTVTDDGANLTGATVTITNLQDGVNEVLTVDTSGTSITGSYDTATGVLNLSGSDTVANYQQVLRTVKYNNTAVSPNTIARAIAFLVNDGSANSTTATTTLSITSPAPVTVGTVSGPTFAPIGSISDSNPDNIYDVTLGGGTSQLVVELVTPFGNTDVELYDSSGNLLASSTNAGTTSERIDRSSLTAGNYQVRVFQASAGVAVDYLLRMNAA